MSEIKTVAADLSISIYVTCPNDDCGDYIDLLNDQHTNGVMHDDDGTLIEQVFSEHESREEFKCEEVTCTVCKTIFNVKTLEW